MTCPKGHISVLGLRQPRFKILYESAALALLDGHYGEAVGSFASALERFHEYWVRATLLQVGISAEGFGNTWKLVQKQSERQQGAFYLLYLRERNGTPPSLPNNLVEFRNKVIHQGAIPTRHETENYAERILRLIASMNHELQKQAPKGVQILLDEQVKEIEGSGAVSTTIATIVGHATDIQPAEATLREELDSLKARRGGTDEGYEMSALPFSPGGR